MKAFLLKHKWTFIFWIVFLAIVLFFAPRQHDYYLENDIKSFKQTYLTQVLLWTGIITSVAIFILVLIKAKSLKQSAIAFLSAGVTLAFFLFIFQDILLGVSLFLNRQVKRNTLQRSYLANYLAEADHIKVNFYPYDLSTKKFSSDKKLISRIFTAGLKQNDTVKLTCYQGLLGIPFQSKPLIDK